MTDVFDARPPRFSRIRWRFVRTLLGAMNVLERWTASVREWALQEAVESSPDYTAFEQFIHDHYQERGVKATVSVIQATVIPPPTPEITHAPRHSVLN